MEQINIKAEPDKKPDSKNFLIAIIIVLAIGFVVLGFLLMRSMKENAPTETEAAKTSVPSTTTAPASTVTNESTAPAAAESASTTSTTTVAPPAEVKKADLYVKSYTLSETPKVGSEFTATIVIGNKGQAASTESYWEWWATASKQVCNKKIGAIAVGGVSTVQCKYTYTDWDDYTTKVVVDSQGDVDESNETNNISTKAVTPLHGKPDLTITEYDFNHDPVMGEEFKVEITIKNKGETDAEEFKWEWWSNAYSSSCDGEVDGLEAGASKEVSCEYTYDGWSNYATKAVVDVDDEVNEKNEGNNTSTKNVIPEH